MAVAPLAVANHHPNPSLETNANNWSAWPTPTGTATIARQTTGGLRGSACMQVTCDGTVGGQGIGLDLGSSNTPGSTAQWGGSVDLRGNVGGEQVQVWTRHNYSDGTILDGTRTVATLTTSWQRFIAPLMAAPAAGKTINSVTIFVRTGSAAALTFFADGARVTTDTVDQITYCDGATVGYQWAGTANASSTIRQRTGGPGDIANWFTNPGAEVNVTNCSGYWATPITRGTDWSAYGTASFKGGPAAYEATRAHGIILFEYLTGVLLGEVIRMTATFRTDRDVALVIAARGGCGRNSTAVAPSGQGYGFSEGLGAQNVNFVAGVPQRVTVSFTITTATVPADFTQIVSLAFQARTQNEAPDQFTIWGDGFVFERDTAVAGPTVNIDGSTPGYGWQGAVGASRTQVVPQRAVTATARANAAGPNVLSIGQTTLSGAGSSNFGRLNCSGATTTTPPVPTPHGTPAMQLTMTTTGTSGGVYPSLPSGRIPVVAGQTYTSEAKVIPAAAGRGMNVGIEWFDAAGVRILTSNATQVAASVTAWNLVSFTGTAPAGAAFCTPTFYFQSIAVVAGDVAYFCEFQLNRASTTLAWASSLDPSHRAASTPAPASARASSSSQATRTGTAAVTATAVAAASAVVQRTSQVAVTAAAVATLLFGGRSSRRTVTPDPAIARAASSAVVSGRRAVAVSAVATASTTALASGRHVTAVTATAWATVTVTAYRLGSLVLGAMTVSPDPWSTSVAEDPWSTSVAEDPWSLTVLAGGEV